MSPDPDAAAFPAAPEPAAPTLVDEAVRISLQSLQRIGVFTVGADGRVRSWSPGAANLTGYPAAAAVGRPLATLMGAEEPRHDAAAAPLALSDAGGAAEHDGWWLRRDGTRFWGRLWLGPAAEADAPPGTLVASLVDLSDRRAELTRLAEQEQCFRSLFAGSPDAVLTLDLAARVTGLNPVAAALLGEDGGSAGGESCWTLVEPASHAAAQAAFARACRGETGSAALALRHPHAGPLPLRGDFVPIRVGGQVAGAFLVLRSPQPPEADAAPDARERAGAAWADPLTGLAGPDAFRARLRRSEGMRQRAPGHLFGVLVLGLDRFAAVTRTVGALVGERLLAEVARRVERSVRPGDTVSRLRGDEFAVLVEGLREPGDAERVAERVQAALGAPFRVGDGEMHLSASLGVEVSASRARAADDLVRAAEAAMRRGKARAATAG